MPRRSGDPACLIADTAKAQMLLGWQAEYRNIEDILTTAVNWTDTMISRLTGTPES
jgi:UDP-glucose 4-epimerase